MTIDSKQTCSLDAVLDDLRERYPFFARTPLRYVETLDREYGERWQKDSEHIMSLVCEIHGWRNISRGGGGG